MRCLQVRSMPIRKDDEVLVKRGSNNGREVRCARFTLPIH